MKTAFITDINKIKFKVNTEVALAGFFAGENWTRKPMRFYKLIPGRTPHPPDAAFTENEIIQMSVYSWL